MKKIYIVLIFFLIFIVVKNNNEGFVIDENNLFENLTKNHYQNIFPNNANRNAAGFRFFEYIYDKNGPIVLIDEFKEEFHFSDGTKLQNDFLSNSMKINDFRTKFNEN